MYNPSRARTAGIIGVGGALLWLTSVIMQIVAGSATDIGTLGLVHETFALTGMAGALVGFLGLLWGGAFRGRFGALAVLLHVLAYGLILLGGILMLLLGGADSPLLLLFPIGGALEGVSVLLLIVAVLVDARWSGWQRWIPLLYAVFHLLAMDLPMVMGVSPDGPSSSVEFGLGVWWLLVALAVYTAAGDARRVAAPAAEIR